MKQLVHILICIFLLCASSTCNQPKTLFTQGEKAEIIAYFKEIALGFEYSSNTDKLVSKWQEPMYLYVDGNHNQNQFIDQLISQLNSYFSDAFYIQRVYDKTQANSMMYLGDKQDFYSKYQKSTHQNISAQFWVKHRTNSIFESLIFVSTTQYSQDAIHSMILEELVQSLGLGNDSKRYQNSIFYEDLSIEYGGGFASQLSAYDKKLIEILYHPDMLPGMMSFELDALIAKILLEQDLYL